ncbi:serine hydrolase domain-containing protein [Metallibacterium sp.]|jgi:beta-lactamase class C|uniref:serine hydrolase domain-containing protein n=1 Tax=Metallibacterium sp. TaxID=2940281 RepID=UPI0031B9C5A8
MSKLHWRRVPLALAAVVLIALSLAAQAARSGTEVPIGGPLPRGRVASSIRAYDGWLDQVMARNDVAGIATAVIVDDKVRWQRTLGYADAVTGARVTPHTVFRIASLSKAFASALTGLLVQDGTFGWNTRIEQALPFFMLKNAEYARSATIADILSQRLGLPHNAYDNVMEDNGRYPELVRKLDEVEPICPPGDCYSYQNVAFSLIGDVVYAETGDFYYHQVEKRLFLPLGMRTATYGREALEASKSWARPHWLDRGRWVPFQPREAYYRLAPAAGVNASLDDLEKWLIAQMGGDPQVLSPHLLHVLHTPLVETPSERWATPWRRARLRNAQYALAWRVYDYAGHRLIFHAGAVQGYRAMIGFFPDLHVGMVILWNCDDAVPAQLMPMFFDKLLGLPYVDWAGLDRARERAHPVRKRRHPR